MSLAVRFKISESSDSVDGWTPLSAWLDASLNTDCPSLTFAVYTAVHRFWKTDDYFCCSVFSLRNDI